MGRIYSNYEEQELENVKIAAEELGFSMSAFQRYCVLLYLGNRVNAVPLCELQDQMLEELKKREGGSTFIVSALFPNEWAGFSRSTKMQLAKFLSKHVKKHPEKYIVVEKVNGTTNKYKKIE